jgi:hypothetical protein
MLTACAPRIRISPPPPERPLPPIPPSLLIPCQLSPSIPAEPGGGASRGAVRSHISDAAFALAECEAKRQLAVRAWPLRF